MQTHLDVDYGQTVPVRLAHNAVDVLKPRGQEGPVGSLEPCSLGLLEAQEINPPDAMHVAPLWCIEGDQV